MSLAALEALTAGVSIRCEVVERDRHGRLVAKVFFSPKGVDIGRRLVSAGWALAYRGYKNRKMLTNQPSMRLHGGKNTYWNIARLMVSPATNADAVRNLDSW